MNAPSGSFREPGAAQAGGYALAVAGVLVALGLTFHPLPSGGFEESASVLSATPWWGAIHVSIAMGFVLCALGGLLILVAGGVLTRRWTSAFCWGALTIGILFFAGVALINGWVMHFLAASTASAGDTLVFDAFNRLLVGYGWLSNPLFLLGLTGVAYLEYRHALIGMPRWVAAIGVSAALLSWLRGVGSATGLHFLEPFILANIPAFLWLGAYGLRIARVARTTRPWEG